jgi:flagellar hook-associated protein 1 FlgK
MSVNKLFDISRRSLLTYQKALSITSNNVANANNPDYSRQRSLFSSVSPDYRTNISIGSGVQLTDVERIRDQIIDRQSWEYRQNFNSAQKQSSILANIESLFSEPSEQGMSVLLDKFFNSWDDLSVDPTSSALRSNVVYAAENLSVKLQNVYEGMTTLKQDLKKDSQVMVEDLNNYITELRHINKQIYEATVVNKGANDLLDKRDELLNKMSEIANIQVNIDEYGVANVSIGGVFAVDRIHSVNFEITEESNGKLALKTDDGNAKVALRSGELYGNFRSANEFIPEAKKQFDDLFNSIVFHVNQIHSQGYTTTDPPVDGVDFFEGYSNGVLKINQDIIDDPQMIAVSKDGTNGNNELALEMAKLQHDKLLNGATFADNYANIVGSLASEKQYQDQNTETFGLVLNQLEQQISSVSGVSIDEEMIDVLKYQRSYDASAKLISIADEMMKTVLQMI